VVLLVEDAWGYANLCRILTARMLDPAFRLVPGLAARTAGLHVLASDPELLRALAARVPRERLWAALPAPYPARFPEIADAARSLGLRLVAAGPVNGVAREEHRLHAVLTAIRKNTLVDRLEPRDLAPREAYLKAPAAIVSLYRRYPRPWPTPPGRELPVHPSPER
jgi:DNA polymerase III alpha subunit